VAQAQPPTVTLRPIGEEDQDFLLALYGTTRADELALVDWDEAQKAAFVRQQFDAQHRYYQQIFPQGSFQVILADDVAAGRLYLDDGPDETRIVDIALMPHFQGHGIGTALVSQVLAGAAARGASITIHVERNNPALRWYARLGFRLVEDQGVYLLLRWQAPHA
jgi:ribosomal protein S18 acetylase RimI-like enzyme